MHSQGTLVPQCKGLALPQDVGDNLTQVMHVGMIARVGKRGILVIVPSAQYWMSGVRVMHALQA